MPMTCWAKYLPDFALASSEPEYFFREGCFIQEWHNNPDDDSISIARVRVEVGATTKLHALAGTTERYAIISGNGEVNIAGTHQPVTVGDVVVIAPDEAQQIANTGDKDLLFLAICTPRFQQENYLQLED